MLALSFIQGLASAFFMSPYEYFLYRSRDEYGNLTEGSLV